MSALALVASLVTVVRRGEDGRRLAGELRALEGEARIVADRIVSERARVDSLTTLARIENAAGAIGLRRAVDEELVQVEAGSGWDEAAGGVSEVGGDR